jgi:ribosomal protein L7/L12
MNELIFLVKKPRLPRPNQTLAKDKLTNKKAAEDQVRKGDRIGAIQEYMRQTRAGLKDSKDAVDAMMKKMLKQ